MIEKRGIRQSYSVGPYNKFDDKEQWIRISQGCPNHCPFCYEPPKLEWYGVPEIVRNEVHIMDMNLLAQTEGPKTIRQLRNFRVNGDVVRYTLVCGIDHRFLTKEIAQNLYTSRFFDVRVAWDWSYADQAKIANAVRKLKAAGYSTKDLQIFMLCNWEIPFSECVKKLNLCKYWGVQVVDCYFDGQTAPKVEPIGWTPFQIKAFRHEVRKHNQFVNFGIDPELKPSKQEMVD